MHVCVCGETATDTEIQRYRDTETQRHVKDRAHLTFSAVKTSVLLPDVLGDVDPEAYGDACGLGAMLHRVGCNIRVLFAIFEHHLPRTHTSMMMMIIIISLSIICYSHIHPSSSSF